MRLAAWNLIRSQSALGAKFRRLRTRLGAPKAITAMAHHLARLIYRMLKFVQAYVDKGMEYYETKHRQQQIHWLKNKPPLFICNSFHYPRLTFEFLESEVEGVGIFTGSSTWSSSFCPRD